MTSLRTVAAACIVCVLSAHPLVAQDLSRYREFVLESSVASVVKISGTREADAKLRHSRPAKIQELEWRAPYVQSGSGTAADPVRDIMFSFYDDQLYQVVVTYERERMEGLTNEDVIESISATYGVALLQSTPRAAPFTTANTDAKVVAQWENAVSLLTLTRGTYPSRFQLVLVSKALHLRALAAIKEALRLDAQEAPQRELDQRKKDVVNAGLASDRARVANKAAFKP